MPDLAAQSPGAGLFPLRHGGITARELPRAPIHVAPSDIAPGTWRAEGEGRLLWFAAGQGAWLGAAPPGPAFDQTDAWCRVVLAGPGSEDVLARLVPLDMAALGEGACARTQVGHMDGLVARTPEGVEIWVFRSMAATLAHDLARAMRHVAARRARL